MQTKSYVSSLLACVVATLALACGIALIPAPALGKTPETYNLTVGNTLVGKDSNKWQGEGETRSYVYDEGGLSYTYYPATSTLKLNGGTITGYYVYNDGLKDVEVGGVISVNCVPCDLAITDVGNLTVEVAEDTAVLISQHSSANADPSAHAFADNSRQTTVHATVCGPSTLAISTDGTLDSCSVTGLMFNEVELSSDNPAHIVFDSIRCACNNEDGFCGFTGIDGNMETSIGQGCAVEFNTIAVNSAGIAKFAGITGSKATVESNAQVTLHNLDYSCGETAKIGYSHVALFHVFGNFTSTGDIRMAPDVDDAVSVSLANKSEDGHEKIIVAGIAVDYQAANADVCVSGTFTMNNVMFAAYASASTYEEGDVFLTGIHNGSNYGATSLTNLNFTFNKYGKSSISIGGKSIIRLAVRAVDEYLDLEARDSTFDITLPKVDATYLCLRSDVAGLMVCAATGEIDISSSSIDIRYSDITVENGCVFLGHAGLVAAKAITIDGISRCTLVCTETGEMAGIEAGLVTLADDALLEIQAPVDKPAIVEGLNNAVYAHADSGMGQSSSAQPSLAGSGNDDIVQLAEGYTPRVTYGANAQSAVTAATLEPQQYGENSFFAIANTVYDHQVSFDSMGGSAAETQTVHNFASALKPADPLKEGYAFEAWCTNADCTDVYDFDTPVVKDITLYAKWKADETQKTGESVPATGDSSIFAVLPSLVLAACVLMGATFARKRAKLK